MYALEFETEISGTTLTIPAEVANQIGQGQHVRVIMLLEEQTPAQTTAKPAVKNSPAAFASRRPQRTKAEISQLLATTRGSIPGKKSKDEIDREIRLMREEWVREWE